MRFGSLDRLALRQRGLWALAGPDLLLGLALARGRVHAAKSMPQRSGSRRAWVLRDPHTTSDVSRVVAGVCARVKVDGAMSLFVRRGVSDKGLVSWFINRKLLLHYLTPFTALVA